MSWSKVDLTLLLGGIAMMAKDTRHRKTAMTSQIDYPLSSTTAAMTSLYRHLTYTWTAMVNSSSLRHLERGRPMWYHASVLWHLSNSFEIAAVSFVFAKDR